MFNSIYAHDKSKFIMERIYNNSGIILCFGDSYTNGQGLTNPKDTVFGSIIARQNNYDWFNLGVNGISNSGMLINASKVITQLNESNYESGVIVLTFTENGRDIRDVQHRSEFDYISNYRDKVIDHTFYELVLDDVENEWIETLSKIRNVLDSRFKIIVGVNFAWHSKLAQYCINSDDILYIQKPWINMLGYTENLPRTTYPAVMNEIHDLIGTEDMSQFKLWVLRIEKQINNMFDWMEISDFFDEHDLGHPNIRGHYIWASEINKIILFY